MKNLLCRLGVHSYVDRSKVAQPTDPAQWTLGDSRVCRRCGKAASVPDQSLWWGERTGITVGQLLAALDGVPSDVEVEVESQGLTGWAGADSAYLTTKKVALATDNPHAVPVFRIAGGDRGYGTGMAPPGMGG